MRLGNSARGPVPLPHPAAPGRRLHGLLEYDRKKDTFNRFDLIALGDVWGRWGDANNKRMAVERPRRNPVLIAFELATGDSPTSRIPPGGWGSHSLRAGYFG